MPSPGCAGGGRTRSPRPWKPVMQMQRLACPLPPAGTSATPSDTPMCPQATRSLRPRRPRLPSVDLSVAPAQPAACLRRSAKRRRTLSYGSSSGTILRSRRRGARRASFKGTRIGTRVSLISICKGPALRKARISRPRRTSSAPRGPPPAAQPAPPRPAPPPAESPGAPRPGRRPRHPLPRCRPAPGPRGQLQPRPRPREGSPDCPAGAAPGLRAPPGRVARVPGGAPRLPSRGAHAPGAAAGTMAAGALSTRRRWRRRRLRDGRAQRARLPARPPPSADRDSGEEGPGPRGEEEPGRRRSGRGSSSAAPAAGAAEGGAPSSARALAGSALPPLEGDCPAPRDCSGRRTRRSPGPLGDLNLERPRLSGVQVEVSAPRSPPGWG